MTEKLTEWRKQFEAELQLEAALHAPEVALSRHDDGTYRVPAVQSAWWGYQAGRRTTTDREAGLEEAAVFMEQRAAEIEVCGNMTGRTIALIYRDEADKIRSLKTTPTAALGEES
ncbi:hypothetical protein [Burkholderia pseudomallei]|uniref:hypothetical protein n=1 Tax=Burkholderia pseudomallei TaxID=28450 RepID=UPI002116F93B|nr:hypothetical protein [Burkholderia pseudomallei]